MQKLFHFIKYNNATIIILAIVLILGGGALAAGPENIGQKQTSIEGVDNTALLAADLSSFNMDFKIENIEQDEKYYYVTYSFLDLALIDNAWQYQLSQKTQKISKKIKEDIGVYMAKFMAKHHEARVRELSQEKSQTESQGVEKRVEVTEYSGLIGRTLNLAAAVFPGYEPVKKIELPTPENFNLPENNLSAPASSGAADNLTQIYNDYISAHPEIFETPTDTASGTPSTVDTVVPETPAASEDPAILEPTSVEVIDLPAPEELPTLTPVEPTPAPAEPMPTESTPAAETPAETPAPEAPAPTEPAPTE
jgi:hypothetical protein